MKADVRLVNAIQYRLRSLLGEDADKVHFLVAVSGGRDSMALLHALRRRFSNILVVHFNYHLRGAESDADQRLVEEYCRSKGLSLEVEHRDPAALGIPANTQDWARSERYRYLMEAPRPWPCVVLTAHHAQDQVETILYRILKGYPPDLCSGMAPIRLWKGGRLLVRPMLEIEPSEIQAYAEAVGLEWRDDSSNATDAYARNRIRHHVLPALATALGEDWADGLLSFAGKLHEEHHPEDTLARDAFGNPTLPLAELRAARYPGRLLTRLTGRYISPGAADEIIRTLSSGRFRIFRTVSGRYLRERNEEIVFITNERMHGPIEIDSLPMQVRLASGQTALLEAVIAPDLEAIKAEARLGIYYLKLESSFTLRLAAAGDRIALPGRQRETKVRELLEKQTSVLARETAWVLEKNGEIAFLSLGRPARHALAEPGNPALKLKVNLLIY